MTTKPVDAAIDAIHVRVRSDAGPGTEPGESWEYWAVRGRGHRMQMGQQVHIYNEQLRRTYQINSTDRTAASSRGDDRLLILELLSRGNADRNAEVLSVRHSAGAAGVKETTEQRPGGAMRRLSAIDASGRPCLADIDVTSNRVLRTESWTAAQPGFPSVHVVTEYDYPVPESFGATFFGPPDMTALKLTTMPADGEARAECAGNLRNLTSLIWRYAADRDDALPARLDDLTGIEGFDPAMLSCPLGGANGPVRYLYGAGGPSPHTLGDTDPDAVLVECLNHPGFAIRGYGDGHAMTVELEDHSRRSMGSTATRPADGP